MLDFFSPQVLTIWGQNGLDSKANFDYGVFLGILKLLMGIKCQFYGVFQSVFEAFIVLEGFPFMADAYHFSFSLQFKLESRVNVGSINIYIFFLTGYDKGKVDIFLNFS